MRIRVEDVSYTYPGGVRALDRVSLQIDSGQCLALVGENGAGKTTLAKHLNGLLRPDEGAVWVEDWNSAEHGTAELAARVGFLFQNPDDQLFARNVNSEVAFGPRNLGLDGAQLETRVNEALDRVGLSGAADKNPYDLAYADRKLVALAATLAMQTPVLVLDEITIGQDAVQRQMLARIVGQLKAEGRTVILISHDLDFCADVAERLVVMVGGRVLADGPAGEIFTQSDLLAQAAVHPPQLVRLAQALGMPRSPLKVEEFVVAYGEWRKERRAP